MKMSLDKPNGSKIFRKSCRLSTLLGIMPFYNFDKNQVIKRVFYKVYSVIYILVLGMVMVHSYAKTYYYMEFAAGEDGLAYTQRFLQAVIDIFNIVLGIMTILGSAFWDMEKWGSFFRKLSKMERLLKNTPNNSGTTRSNSILLATNLTFLCCIFLQNYAWVRRIGLEKQYKYFVTYYLIYINHNKVTLIYYFIKVIKCRFEELNDLFKLRYKKSMSVPVEVIMSVYRQLYETVEMFNSLFGWQLLLSITYCSLVSLNCVHISFLKFFNKSDIVDKVTGLTAVFSILMAFFTLSNPILVMLSSDCAMKEAQNIITICYKHQENLPTFSEDMQKLRDLANQAMYHKPSFTAAGFFEINRSSLFALLGTIITYLIIIMQFNQI